MFTINFPVKIYFGRGEIQNLVKYTEGYGQRAFVVMDPYLQGNALQRQVLRALQEAGKEVVTYYEIVPNPTTHLIDKAAELARQVGSEFVVAIGGGSTIDTAKAVALLVTNGGQCWDYTERLGAEVVRPQKHGIPLLAIPTTAGTGTEATPYSVISNPDLKQKCTIVNPRVFPTISIVDPELMASMPPMLTALTGIDAFSHAFESYINVNASPFSEMVALESMRLFARSIEAAVKNGDNLEAREKMALSCTMAGMAIAHAGTTVPHALGQPLSGLTNAPHGGSIAACLPEVVEWTLPLCQKKFANVAAILDAEVAGLSEAEKAARLPGILADLFTRIGVNVTFGGYGLKEEEIEDFCDLVYNSFQLDLKGHPKVATREDLVAMVKKCM